MKIAVLGCGIMGKTHARNLAKMADVQLAAVYDVQEQLAGKLAGECGAKAYSSFETMMDEVKPDVVSVCLPTYLHKEFVLKAAGYGVDIICEKPIAPTLEEAAEMIAVCRDKGVRLFIAHVLRFFPNYADIKRKIDAGAVGQVGVVHTKRAGGHPGRTKPWYAEDGKSGGVIMDLLIHDIDFMRSAVGEVASVYALRRQTADLDYALVTLRFENGAIANLEGYWGYPGPFTTAAEVAGNKGIIRFNSQDATSVKIARSAPPEGAVKKQVAVPSSPAYHDPYYYELAHFIACIRDGREPLVTAADAYRAIEIALAANVSAQTGMPVQLPAAAKEGGATHADH